MNTSKETGLSMVELLVALAISSFLILGVTQIYIDNKRNHAFQQNLSENQEGSRYVLLLLQQELSKAGYRRRPDEPFESAFPAATVANCTFGTGRAVVRRNATELCIRYQPHSHVDRDCLGNTPATASTIEDAPYTHSGEVIAQRFYLNEGALWCQVVHSTNGTAGAAQSGELIAGLADIRLEYGAASATDPRAVGSYTDTPSTAVLAVRYSALLRSSGGRQRDALDADDALKTWQTLTGANEDDTSLAALKTADKGNLYQVSQSAIMLRNLLP